MNVTHDSPTPCKTNLFFVVVNLNLDQIRKFFGWKEKDLILLYVTHFLLITPNTIKRDISIVVQN
jgi:hypothetical protein